MAKSENQKLKLLYLLKLLEEKSDEEHTVSTREIIEYMDQNGIAVERKTVYSDLKALQEFGYPVKLKKGRSNPGAYLDSRRFELPELKLLVDAVLASKFITAEKTKELIRKIAELASVHQAKALRRQVYVDRIKNENDQVYANVDEIHRAMQENLQIAFFYYSWGKDKQLHARRANKRYQVSPFFLVWRDEYYYLVAYDGEAEKTKYYRVDKMQEMEITSEKRIGHEVTGKVNPAEIARSDFSMFSGNTQPVTLTFPEEMIGVVIDRFGKELTIRDRGEGVFSVRIPVSVSPQFFGWLTGLSGKVKILMPEAVKEEYLAYLQKISESYQ